MYQGINNADAHQQGFIVTGNSPPDVGTWLYHFPVLAEISDPAWKAVVKTAGISHFAEGAHVYRERETCSNYLLVATGSVRVQKSSENGGVITLYHLEAGQACELTASCLLGNEPYPAEAVAESAVTLVAIPGPRFQEALIHSPQFRQYVFSSLGKGMNELVTLVEEVAFGQMHGRLARCLLGKSHQQAPIETTHQDLAEELGSAREVISRLLKKFEHHGWVRLHRGRIEIINREILQDLSKHIDR